VSSYQALSSLAAPPRRSGHALPRGNRAARRCRPARRPTSAPIRVTVVAAEPVTPFRVCLARASVRSRDALHDGVRCSEVVQANCACLMQAPTQGSKRTDLPYVLGRAVATPGLTLRGTRNRWAAELEFRRSLATTSCNATSVSGGCCAGSGSNPIHNWLGWVMPQPRSQSAAICALCHSPSSESSLDNLRNSSATRFDMWPSLATSAENEAGMSDAVHVPFMCHGGICSGSERLEKFAVSY
jgi:hypothetical protein